MQSGSFLSVGLKAESERERNSLHRGEQDEKKWPSGNPIPIADPGLGEGRDPAPSALAHLS